MAARSLITRAPSVSVETVNACPGFSTAAAGLRRLRPPSYSKVQAELMELGSGLRAARILKELDPDKLTFRDGVNWLRDDDAHQSLLEAAVEAIGQVAPLQEESVEIDMMDGYIRLVPAELGYAMNWDEWYEMVSEPGEYLNETAAPWAFCEALLQGDESAFDSFSDYFDWDLRYPRRGGERIDWKKMQRLLEKRGLGCFKAAFEIAGYCTGNLYFDYNIYEDNLPLPDFTIEGVRELERQYLAAQPILRDYRACVHLFAEIDVPRAVLRIYSRSLVKEEKKPKTLVEVFREEEERERVRIGPEQARPLEDDEENDYTDPMGVLERINGELRETTEQLTRMYHELGLETPDERNEDD
jgi:hypothetical protein